MISETDENLALVSQIREQYRYIIAIILSNVTAINAKQEKPGFLVNALFL